jgi:hypothetical protein
MKQSDFDRLKEVCKQEGFELCYEWPTEGDNLFVVKKAKDLWEGVEFVESIWSGSIFKIDQMKVELNKDDYKPSTEAAYVEQLKEETYKRFGEINEGDSFIDWNGTDFTMIHNLIFEYIKRSDSLRLSGWCIYHKGKWATKVIPSGLIQIEVKKPIAFTNTDGEILLSFCTNADWADHDLEEIKKKMRSKLAKLLNQLNQS